MSYKDLAADIKVWVVAGLLLGLLIGYDRPDASDLIMISLIVMMTISFIGVEIHKKDLADNHRQILTCVLCCFTVNTLINIFTGLFFLEDTALWYGWLVFACTPCGVGVISGAILVKADTKLSAIGCMAVYLSSLIITPIMTFLLLGDAVNPYEIVKCIVLFILVPYILSVPFRRVRLSQRGKVSWINLTLFFMMFLAVGSRREYIFEYPATMGWLAVACFLRLAVFTFVMILFFRHIRSAREHALVYTMMSVWKSAGICISMCLVLLGSTYPEAVLPGITSLVIEMIWTSIMASYHERFWPIEGDGKHGSDVVSSVENN